MHRGLSFYKIVSIISVGRGGSNPNIIWLFPSTIVVVLFSVVEIIYVIRVVLEFKNLGHVLFTVIIIVFLYSLSQQHPEELTGDIN